MRSKTTTEHQNLAEERRKLWQRATRQIAIYQKALSQSKHSAAERERARNAARTIADLSRSSAELPAVAKWCVLLRNDPRLARLLG